MKRLSVILALAALCGLALTGCAQPSVSELGFAEGRREEYINWYGRCYWNAEAGEVSFPNSSSGFEVRFRGTKLTAEIVSTSSKSPESFGNPAVYVFVDGETDYKKARRVELDGYDKIERCELVSGLEQGEHTVKVLKCTQSKYGQARLQKLQADGGFLTPPPRPARKAEIIGDSILSGCEALCEVGSLDSGLLENENSLAAYGTVAARTLGAEVNAVCRAGALVSGYQDLPSIPDYYDLYDEYSAAPWDFSLYAPDFVVIDLGSNDLGNDTPVGFFVEKYAAFLAHVREKYPDAAIFCCTGAMYTLCDEPVSGMVEKRNAAGDANVYHFQLPALYNGGHPRERQHKENGETLARFISEKCGYSF